MSELRSGEALRTVSPNLHVNCLFEHDNACIVAELQIHIMAILETKRETHKVGAPAHCLLYTSPSPRD